MLAAGACLSARADDVAAPTAIRDLYYGEALFQFYQDEHFDALTHLLAARAAGRVGNHEAESELLLGGLYLHYGQHVRAEEIFNRLLTQDVAPSVRDRAWFYLGKVRYQRGLHEDALAAFARVSGALPEGLAAELPMLQAQSLMALERFDSAAELLDGWQGPEGWAPYARYNLGVAFVRLNRLDDGARQLDRVGRSSPSSAELLDLRDKANLALGYAYLQQSLDGQARPVLERVRLESPFANKALLGVGWADAAAHDFRGALTPWLELRNRDLLDSAVQESLLAIPYAYAELDAHGSAAEGYQSALASFDAEIANLDDAISRRRGSRRDADQRTARGGRCRRRPLVLGAQGAARLQRRPLPLSPDRRPPLPGGTAERAGPRRALDAPSGVAGQARRLRGHGGHAAPGLCAAGAAAPGGTRPGGPAGAAGPARRARRAPGCDRGRAGTWPGSPPTRNGTAGSAWPRIGADPGLAAADAAGLRDRHRLLTGVLAWELDRDYQYRLWQQRRNLRELDALLARATRGQDGAATARRDTPAGLDGFAARIAAVAPRIERMQNVIAQARGQQEQQLQALAIDTLKDQRERLAAYRVQAQFALATIYDRAATAARVAPQSASSGKTQRGAAE